jgi:hypothetical protein
LAEAQEQLYKIGKAAGYVGECAGVLATVYKKDAGPLLGQYVKPFFEQTIADYKNLEDRELIDTLFFFVNFLDQCGSSDFMFVYEMGARFAEIGSWAEEDQALVR